MELSRPQFHLTTVLFLLRHTQKNTDESSKGVDSLFFYPLRLTSSIPVSAVFIKATAAIRHKRMECDTEASISSLSSAVGSFPVTFAAMSFTQWPVCAFHVLRPYDEKYIS